MKYTLEHFKNRNIEELEQTDFNRHSMNSIYCVYCSKLFVNPGFEEMTIEGKWVCPNCATQEIIDMMNKEGY